MEEAKVIVSLKKEDHRKLKMIALLNDLKLQDVLKLAIGDFLTKKQTNLKRE